MTSNGEPRYGSARDAAAILHVSPKTLSRWAREHKVPCQRTLGGHARYDLDEIRELARTLRVEVAEVAR